MSEEIVVSSESRRSDQSHFATTHWSVVLGAGQTSSPQASAALEQLCRTYRYPLYEFVRRRGHNPHDAPDLTQAFFARLLEKKLHRAGESRALAVP